MSNVCLLGDNWHQFQLTGCFDIDSKKLGERRCELVSGEINMFGSSTT